MDDKEREKEWLMGFGPDRKGRDWAGYSGWSIVLAWIIGLAIAAGCAYIGWYNT